MDMISKFLCIWQAAIAKLRNFFRSAEKWQTLPAKSTGYAKPIFYHEKRELHEIGECPIIPQHIEH